jgi:hypothetical protein
VREEEQKMRVFENSVLRKISAPKRDEVTGKWRRLHNEELHDLYSFLNIGMTKPRMRWAGHIAHMGDRRGAYRILVGKPEERRPLVRHRRRWESNIRINPREVGCRHSSGYGQMEGSCEQRSVVGR